MSNKKTFFVRVDKDGIDAKQSAKEFADFLGEETTTVRKTIKDELSKVDIAETVFGMFDELEAEIESRKTPVVEEEEKPISFTTQEEVDGFNELSEILHSDDVAGTMLEQLTGVSLDLDEEETFDGHMIDPPQAILQEEIVSPEIQELEESINQEIEHDPTMSQYVDRVRLSNKGVEFDLTEQDLQNTPASMADLQKATQRMMQNIQTSLTSLGGGGLGEPDVVKLIKEYAPPIDLTDSDLDYIVSNLDSSLFGGLDSAEITSMIDSAVALEHQFNVAEHAVLDSAINQLETDISNLPLYGSGDFDADFSRKTTDALPEGSTNLYYTDIRVEKVVDSMRDGTWFTGQLATNNLSGLKDVHFDSLQPDQVLTWNGSVWGNDDPYVPPPLLTYHGDIDCTTDPAPTNPGNGDTYLNTGSGAVLSGGNWVGLTTVDSDHYVIYDSDNSDWDTFSMGGSGGVSVVRAGFGINVVGTASMPTVEVDSNDLHTFLADKDENDSAHAQFRSDLTQLRDDHDSDTLSLNTDLAKKVTKTGDTMTGTLKFDRGLVNVMNINPADGTTAVIDLFQGGNSTHTYTDLRLSGATFRNVFRVMGGPSPHEEIMSIPSDASGVTIKSVTVTGQTELNAKLTLNHNADITGNVDIGGTLDVTGQSTFLNNITIKNGFNLRVVDGGEVLSNSYNSVGNSNVSLKRNGETNLQLLGKTTRAQKVVDYASAAQSRIYSDSAVADTFLTHKGYVTDTIDDMKTLVDSDLSKKFDKVGGYISGQTTVTSGGFRSNTIGSNGNSNLNIQRNGATKIQITSSQNKQFQKAVYNADYGVVDDLDIPHKKYVDSAIDSAVAAIGVDSDLAVQVAENTDDITGLTVATTKNTVFNASLIEAGVMPTGYTSNHPISNAFQDIPNKRIIGWPGYGV